MTITQRGCLLLNRAARAAMGEPEAVELLYDQAERIVGLRPVPVETPHAFRVGISGDGAWGSIGALGFVRHYGIDRSVARRRLAYLDDGVLCVDLRQPGYAVTSNRARPS